MLSYYGSSPLNLLLALVPEREFRVLYTLFVALRVGFAGLFMGMFLKKISSRRSGVIPFFATGYALCGYMMGYYWNVMWLDSVALLPLLCLGLLKLFREERCSLYVSVLALCLFSNYYIGYMCCVFMVLLFFALYAVDRVNVSAFLHKGFRLLLSTLLGAAIPMVLLLPAFFGLFSTASTQDAIPLYTSFYASPTGILAALSSFHTPAIIDGLPNLMTASALSLMAFGFLWTKRISLREKLAGFLILFFLIFSMNFSVLNYVWHGFHFTNMIPYRFAFLFAFAVVVCAYRFFEEALGDLDLFDLILMLIFSAAIPVCAYLIYGLPPALLTLAVLLACVLLLMLHRAGFLSRRVLSLIVCGVILVETSVTAYLGTEGVGYTNHSDYFDGDTGKAVVSMVEKAAEEEKDSKNRFYRMETAEWRSLNDSCFYGYNGISQFASSANRDVSEFLLALGMPADPGSNRFVYVHGTPFADLLLSIRYLIQKNGDMNESSFTTVASAEEDPYVTLNRNEAFCGMGFMIREDAADFSFDDDLTPFERQNALFSAMTGLKGDLFKPLESIGSAAINLELEKMEGDHYHYRGEGDGGEDGFSIHVRYWMREAASVYVYADVPGADYVLADMDWHCISDYPNLFSVGYYRDNEEFQLKLFLHNDEKGEPFEGDVHFEACVLDRALWEQGLAILQDECMTVTSVEKETMEGEIVVKEDGYFYTSIPAEREGNWRVFVDGEEEEIVPFADAFLGLYLEKGEHSLKFVYTPAGFTAGRAVTLAALILFALLLAGEALGFRLFPEKRSAVTEPAPADKEEAAEKEEQCDDTEIDVDHPKGD